MNSKEDVFRILIVDDNKELREILAEYLKEAGESVEGANNGREALEQFEKNPYDLIITDLNMPELTGIDLIKEVAKKETGAEFIIITGYASLDTAIEAIKVGAFDYIVKPFRMEELRVIVKNAKDKIMLKKMNALLFKKLTSFYRELEKYKHNEVKPEPEESLGDDTERIISEIIKLEKLRKGRFLIQ